MDKLLIDHIKIFYLKKRQYSCCKDFLLACHSLSGWYQHHERRVRYFSWNNDVFWCKKHARSNRTANANNDNTTTNSTTLSHVFCNFAAIPLFGNGGRVEVRSTLSRFPPKTGAEEELYQVLAWHHVRPRSSRAATHQRG